jgi:WD40 repeat protein
MRFGQIAFWSMVCSLGLFLGCKDPLAATATLTYAVNPAVYTVGTAITPNNPTLSTGTATAYSVAPALPAGLVLDGTTGVLTGTPTTVAALATYTVTASTASGKVTANLQITVSAAALAIATQPKDQSIVTGQTAFFSVVATGSGALTYQWTRNGTLIGGATSASYITPASVLGDNGALFAVTVADAFGSSVTSTSATLTVTAQPLGVSSPTGRLVFARSRHTATLLPNGQVLMVGGYTGTALDSAELYDPASFSFTQTGSLGTARFYHTATLLQNGKVLITGGEIANIALNTAELFDPATGTFSPTGTMLLARSSHSATRLPNGKVLIVGGVDNQTYLSSAELYDPATGTFAATGSLTGEARANFSATLLSNGKVLIAGGFHLAELASAELYDPATGTFGATSSMLSARSYHTPISFSNGGVLIVGGAVTATVELYNPTTGLFTAAGVLGTPRNYWHTATLLTTGKVFVAGGIGQGNPPPLLSSAELYNPSLGTFSATGSLTSARQLHTATLLNDGRVLVAGGVGPGGALNSAELYQ